MSKSNYLFLMLFILMLGVLAMMSNLVIERERGQSFSESLVESIALGAGFYLLVSAEIVFFANS
ncbi:MAG: hypothetical protein Q8O24_08075 [Gallionellaceae bacterium]|nr:hypothetical protein [Gallionellaceae bacterium]